MRSLQSSQTQRLPPWSALPPHRVLLSCQRPLTRTYFVTVPTHLSHSLANNYIRDEGASALAAVLKETQITNLLCAAAIVFAFLRQRPLTQK